MFKKMVSSLLAAALMVTMLAGCGGSSGSSSSSAASGTGAASGDKKLKVTFVTTEGGLGDRSFNDSAWAGVQRAEKELGVEVSLIEPATAADFGSSIVAAVNGGADVILAFGASWSDTFEEYCPKFPNVRFGGLNVKVQKDNLFVAMTGDHEGSFMAGALAALQSKTGTIGFVGGAQGDNINRFFVGYQEGAKYAKPDIKVLESYVGSFNDPAKGKEFALQLMNQGADVIYHVSSKTGEGVFEAAKENEKLYAIGVDSNQDYIVEGKILSSMMKNCDQIAFDIIKSAKDNTFVGGPHVYGLASGGVGLTDMKFTKDIIGEANLKRLEEIKADVVSGKVKVTDVFAK